MRKKYLFPAVASLAALPLGLAALSSAGPSAQAAPGPTSACTGILAGLSVSAGTNQVAKVGTAFAAPLQAEVVDTHGCPIAGQTVQFSVPATGASGYFPGAAITVNVTTGSDGIATAPTLTANNVTGSFNAQATIATFTTTFSLTNTTVGAVSSVAVTSGNAQSAAIGGTFPEPLVVAVTDAYGDPVAGATVNFAVVSSSGAGGSFVGGGSNATAQTNSFGLATSPALVAGSTAGAFTVTATVSGATSAATFSLTAVAGAADLVSAGVGTTQTAELGTDFAVPLAVTVTDSDSNPVVGATVTFTAPASGPSGVFAGSGRAVRVATNSQGIATAPPFSANQRTGGYVVTATVAGVATPASFALVNEARTSASAPGPHGSYWLVTSGGRVVRSGSAPSLGSVPAKDLRGLVVGMAVAPNERGYWVVTKKGAVYPFGSVLNYGSPVGAHLTKAVVGMASTPDGKGYWLVTAGGQVLPYGDAHNYGSLVGRHLSKPIVGMAATPDGKGYWLASSDGGVFAYGSARYYGSAAAARGKQQVVGIAAAPTGGGYWLVSATGAVSAYGSATNFGSATSLSPKPVRALVPTPDGAGYWVVSANGTVAGFGDAGGQGSPLVPAKTVVAGGA